MFECKCDDVHSVRVGDDNIESFLVIHNSAQTHNAHMHVIKCISDLQ